jgi:hypothetical protein
MPAQTDGPVATGIDFKSRFDLRLIWQLDRRFHHGRVSGKTHGDNFPGTGVDERARLVQAKLVGLRIDFDHEPPKEPRAENAVSPAGTARTRIWQSRHAPRPPAGISKLELGSFKDLRLFLARNPDDGNAAPGVAEFERRHMFRMQHGHGIARVEQEPKRGGVGDLAGHHHMPPPHLELDGGWSGYRGSRRGGVTSTFAREGKERRNQAKAQRCEGHERRWSAKMWRDHSTPGQPEAPRLRALSARSPS